MIFDLFRSGFEAGHRAGRSGQRRRARWELFLASPVLWTPLLVDRGSFYDGYAAGFQEGAVAAKYLSLRRQQDAPPLPPQPSSAK